MAGSKIGGAAARDTNYKKYGRTFYKVIGAIGGSHSRTGGFYANRELASRAGALGGRMSRRGKHKLTDIERLKIRREYEMAYEELLAIHTRAKREREAAARLDTGAITVYDRKRGLVLSGRS